MVTAGPAAADAAAGRGAAAPPDGRGSRRRRVRRSNPLNVTVGDLFYGTEGWAAMSDQGFQAYKGESSELIMEERPERGQPGGDATGLHMENFLRLCAIAQ